MLRSMYSGISGMKVNQTKLDVIGNNISNVNTTSFKSSRASFSDLLSQTSSSAQAASTTKGGTNAKQVGLGVQLASIDKIMTQGSMQTTNRSLDVAIDGTGYFMVSTGPAISGDGTLQVSHKEGVHALSTQSLQSSGAQISYTRDGSFIKDNEGNLLTSSGYRVLGYSLTNDDSSMGATSESPNNVTINDTLNFTFGPGSQLNGYKVQLGAVGSGTTTGAKINNDAKTITINGDFTSETQLTPEAINTALMSALKEAGISQTITASGKVKPLEGIETSNAISGGTDALAPEIVKCGGLTFKFDEGTELENWKIEIADITSEDFKADIDGTTIKISGNFVDGDFTSAQIKDLEDRINEKLLKDKGIKQKVHVSGNGKAFTGLSATAGKSIEAKPPVLSSTKVNSDESGVTSVDTLNGFKITIDPNGKSNDLNGYTIEFKKTTGEVDVKVDPSKATITISGSIDKIVDKPAADSAEISFDNVNKMISDRLSSQGIKESSFTISGKYDGTDTKKAYFANGVDDTSAGNISIGNGITIETPKPSELVAAGLDANLFDGMKFVIGNINDGQTSVKYDKEHNTVTISGNFAESGKVTGEVLAKEINEKICTGNGIGLHDLVSASGSNKIYSQIESDPIKGGSVKKAGDGIDALNLTFTPSEGSALNGYKIQVGTITAGTSLGAKIDEKTKTITVNGDFVKGGYTAEDICKAINKELSNSSLAGASFTVTDKKPTTVSNTESDKILGGTSVQSIGTDGSVYFVDASTAVKSYDGSLKSLKIPEKIKIPGSDTEVAVKDFSISADGVIIATLEGGTRAALGQIAMASFTNPEGLTSTGNNLFDESVNSGSAVIKSGIGTIENDNSKGFGTNIQGYLEMSNVDLAEQFTDMIVTTKAFQGASKMITTGDEILSEIINLKR